MRWINNLISLGILDQAEHGHRVVGRLQAFADERSARIRALAGHAGELCKPSLNSRLR
jgi:hypothetical protein